MTIAPAANDTAAAYQRLRGHLAYLKLNAAIEALPGLLDAARDASGAAEHRNGVVPGAARAGFLAVAPR